MASACCDRALFSRPDFCRSVTLLAASQCAWKIHGYREAAPLISGGIVDDRDGKGEDQEAEQIDGGAYRM